MQTDGYEAQRSNVLKMLGYYSLLGLLRVHSLVGDYHGALKALAPLNPFKRKNLLTPRIAGVPPPQLHHHALQWHPFLMYSQATSPPHHELP